MFSPIYARISQLVILCTSIALLSSCEQQASSHAEQLQQTIEADMNEGLESDSLLSLDLPHLPKTVYHSDKDHSSLSFRTGHWEIVDLVGWFEEFEVVMYADEPDFTDAVIYAEVKPASIHMPNPKMESSARQAPYLDAEQFPLASFMSHEMRKLETEEYQLTGNLKMNGIEKEMAFDVQFNGFAYPGEKPICGFTAIGKIDRHDFLAVGDDRLHSGRKVHSDSIEIRISVRME